MWYNKLGGGADGINLTQCGRAGLSGNSDEFLLDKRNPKPSEQSQKQSYYNTLKWNNQYLSRIYAA